MKHRRIMMLAILLTLVGSIFADNLTVSNIELQAGETQKMAISLNNATKKYVAFQFDVVLPEGISVAKNDKGKLMASLDEDRTDGHSLTVQDVGSGTYRFLCFSLTNIEFYGTSGALLNLTLQADENVSDGMMEGKIKSQVFTETGGTQVKWDDVPFPISIVTEVNDDKNFLTVSNINIKAGNSQEMSIILNNATKKYAAFQFDVVLPEGISVAKNDKGKLMASLDADRTDDHSLTVQDVGSGTYRFLCFSLTNTEFYGTSGALVNMTLQADENASLGTKEGVIKSQVFTETSGKQVKWGNVTFPVSIEEAVIPEVVAEDKTREYGEENPELTYTSCAELKGKPELTTAATKTSPVGEYEIVVGKGSIEGKYIAVNGKLTITKAPLEIGVGTYTIKQGDPLPVFAATYEGFKNDETETVLTKQPTISCEAVVGSAPGEYPITVSGAEAQNYGISYTNGKLVVMEADPVIITVKNYTREYGDENPTFEFSTEGKALDGTPEITCEATKTSPVGTYPIVIKKGSVTNYNDTYVNGTLTITKAPLTITAKDYTIKQGEPLPEFEVTYEGFKNNETEDILTKKPTVTTTATSASVPAEYDITASGAEAQNYDISYVKGKLTITEADRVTVTAKSYTIEYGDDIPTFEYTSEGAELDGTPEITCEATKTSPVGTYPIVIAKGGVTNYNDTYVNGTLTITKAPLTITAKDYTIKQGEALPEFEVSYEGFKNNETEDVLTKKPTVTTTATSASAPAEYDITASGAEAQNYEISYVKGKLTITEADPVTVTARSYTIEYGDDIPTFEYTSEGAVLEGTPEITCEATKTSPVGTYSIVIAKGSVTNYNDTYVNGTLTITKAPLTVTVENYSREQGEENPLFEITYSGWKNGEDESVLLEKPVATTTATKDSPAGDYPITLSGGEAENYEFNYIDGVLTVTEPSGVNGIIRSEETFDVYTTTGVLVRKKTTTMKGLHSGIYIVAGKKVVVK